MKAYPIDHPIHVLSKNLRASIEAKQALLDTPETLEAFARAVGRTIACYRDGGRLYIAGNGGSAADAQHLAAEFVSKLARDRDPLPAEAMTVDSSLITAIGNDYGYEQVFARQVWGKMTGRDVFLGITTSGRSANIIEALKVCRERKVSSLLFSGRDGGPAAALADYPVVACGDATSTIQELHIVLAHTLCECVERAVFPD